MNVFAGGVKVFVSSSPGIILKGEDWLARIEQNLNEANAIIVLISPISINRPWIWFETGAGWLRSRSGTLTIYPVHTSHYKSEELPSPLNRLQATSLGTTSEIKELFRSLTQQFGFGKANTMKVTDITKSIPNYDTVKVHADDIKGTSIYSGPFVGYSDDEFKEILSEYVSSEVSKYNYLDEMAGIQKPNIVKGKLIHFRQLDEELGLPIGTSNRLLVEVAKGSRLKMGKLTPNTVRFTLM